MFPYGKKLKALREARGISQRELARMVNVHQTQISFIERGDRRASFDLMCKVAQALDVPITELVPTSAEAMRA